MFRSLTTLVFCLLTLSFTAHVDAQISSVDSGTSAAAISGWDEALLSEWGATHPWVRIRARPDPSKTENSETVASEAAGLRRLLEVGFKSIPFYRWSPQSWTNGVRLIGGQKLPIDLREAYRRGSNYGETYGSVVAGFEIENEPDISFVKDNAETYVAFLKACYLGLKSGSAVASNPAISDQVSASSPKLRTESSGSTNHGSSFYRELRSDSRFQDATVATGRRSLSTAFLGRPADRWMRAGRLAAETQIPSLRSQVSRDGAPLVVMAPLALPPGPYFEQLVANGLFSYTDAFNYHYYGYAEDFSGVYRQFEHAVLELAKPDGVREHGDGIAAAMVQGADDFGAQQAKEKQTGILKHESSDVRYSGLRYPPSSLHSVRKDLPVLLTEYGYGSLGDPDRNTIEGRVRQWAWFKSVGEQIDNLRIAGPMAFYLPSYFNPGKLEFGLTVREAHRKHETGNMKPEGSENSISSIRSQSSGLDPLEFTAGALTYKPSDFGSKKPEPWMAEIGRRFGENEATPALAWLYDYGRRHPYKPKDWTVRAPEASPVVIDFISGEGLIQAKRYGGYLATMSPNSSDKPGASSSELGPSRQQLVASNQRPVPLMSGQGELVLYNFSDQPVMGELVVTEGRDLVAELDELEAERTLEPMCRVVLPVTLRVPAQIFAKHGFSVNFVPLRSEIGVYPPLAAPEATRDRRLERAAFASFDKLRASSFAKAMADKSAQQAGAGSKPRSPNSNLLSPTPTLSVFSTSFYPEASGMKEIMLFDFSERRAEKSNDQQSAIRGPFGAVSPSSPRSTSSGLPPSPRLWRTSRRGKQGVSNLKLVARSQSLETTAANVALLESRPLATEEPKLEQTTGRWRATRGLNVTETVEGVWRFEVNEFPAEPLKSAMAELPLPDDFVFPSGGMMRMNYRLADPPGADIKTGKYFELYFRTANGNLYQVWPRQYAMANWQEYTEVKGNYTMAFYGRANLPWRFKDNRPVALVFFFRPGKVPATYEVKDARIVRLVEQ